MTPDHIVLFLRSMGESDMAHEVSHMAHRLDAFADGLDRFAFDSMKQAAEMALAQRDELLSLFGELLDQLGERDQNNGNAPGHGHYIPGIWDKDNGRLAGKPCAWCATWAKAKELRSLIPSGKEKP